MPSWKKVILSGSDASLDSISASSFVYSGNEVIAQTNLKSLNSAGSEGGEIFLNRPAVSSSITGGVNIDVYQDRLRIFEQGGSARGGYFDITTLGAGASTNFSFPDSASYAITASYASNVPETASYALQALSSSYAITASYASNVPETASYALQALSSSYALSASYSLTATSASHALNTDNAISSSYALSGSYALRATSASHALNADNAISSSYALSGSYALRATSASHALNADNAISASYALSASYAATASSADSFNVRTALTASNLRYPTADGTFAGQTLQTNAAGLLSFGDVSTIYETVYNGEATTLVKGTPVYVSGSQGANPKVFAADASNAAKMPVVYIVSENIATASTGRGIVLGLITGIDLTGYTAGQEVYVAAGGGWTTTRPTGTSIVQVLGIISKPGAGGQGLVLNPGPANLPNLTTNNIWVGDSNGYPQAVTTSSLVVTNAISASYSATALSASHALASNTSISASHTIFADTASFLPATTNLNIASISASTAVFTSASIGFLQTVSGSATIIGDAYVVVNSSQTTRYAGLAVYESGSVPPVTASWNFDSQTNDWFYSYSSSDATDYAVAIFGPEYTTIGSPIYLTTNRIPKAGDQHHLNDSNISDNGTIVSINSNTQVTGSLTVSSNITSQTLNVTSGTGSFTGSFTGLFDGISASQIATGTGTVNTLAKWDTTSSLTDSSITDNGSNVRIAVSTAVTGSIINNNAGFTSTTFTSGSSIANATTNGTLFTIDNGVYESLTMEYVIFNSTRTNKRAGTFRSTWDDTTSAIVFDETTTTDIGNTSGFSLNASNDGAGTISIRATNNVGSAMTIIYERKLLG